VSLNTGERILDRVADGETGAEANDEEYDCDCDCDDDDEADCGEVGNEEEFEGIFDVFIRSNSSSHPLIEASLADVRAAVVAVDDSEEFCCDDFNLADALIVIVDGLLTGAELVSGRVTG